MGFNHQWKVSAGIAAKTNPAEEPNLECWTPPLTKKEDSTCKVGDKVEAPWPGGYYFPAHIKHVHMDGKADVRWDDGDPNHRTVKLSELKKGGKNCAGLKKDQKDSFPDDSKGSSSNDSKEAA